MTAKVSIPEGPADQIPHIIDGIIVHVRDIQIYVDRPGFTLQPDELRKEDDLLDGLRVGAELLKPRRRCPGERSSSPFQAADCGSLKFKPSFSVSTSAKTSKADGASLHVNLAYPSGPVTRGEDANIATSQGRSPQTAPLTLDDTAEGVHWRRRSTLTPPACPAASVIGHARAITPILPVPLEGPAYFVSHGGEAFPSLVMVLQGYGITIDLAATRSSPRPGSPRSTFKTIPDQPVTSFELTLPEGPYSALAANGNLCRATRDADRIHRAERRPDQAEHPDRSRRLPQHPRDHRHTIKKKTLTLKVYVPAAGKVKVAGKGLDLQDHDRERPRNPDDQPQPEEGRQAEDDRQSPLHAQHRQGPQEADQEREAGVQEVGVSRTRKEWSAM